MIDHDQSIPLGPKAIEYQRGSQCYDMIFCYGKKVDRFEPDTFNRNLHHRLIIFIDIIGVVSLGFLTGFVHAHIYLIIVVCLVTFQNLGYQG